MEGGIAADVVEQFLAHPHPVLLGAVAALVAQRDPVAGRPAGPGAHVEAELRERMKSVLHVRAKPDIERGIPGKHGQERVQPGAAESVIGLHGRPPEGARIAGADDDIVGRIGNAERRRRRPGDALHGGGLRGIGHANTVAGDSIFPDIAWPQAAMGQETGVQVGVRVDPADGLFHLATVWPVGRHAGSSSWQAGSMATPAGLEPATVRLEGGCSIQLSYQSSNLFGF